jgi:hypothetical protein
MDDNLAQQAVDKGYVSSVEEYKQAEATGRAQAGAISATDIQSTPQVTVPTPDTTSSSQTIDQIAQETKLASDKATQEADLSKKTFQDRIKEVVDVMGSREKVEEQEGLGEARLEVADIRNQIEARELSLRRAIENTQKTAGLSGTQIGRRVQALNRDAARELADLSIIESARLRRFDAIETNIERKMKAKLEPLQFQLQFDQMFYQENRQAMTAAQDRAFQVKLNQEEREYKEAKDKQDAIKKVAVLAAQSGATPEQIVNISNAETEFDALMAAGESMSAQFDFEREKFDQQFGLQERQFELEQKRYALQERIAYAEMQRKVEETKPLTSAQAQALGYGERTLAASVVIDEVGNQFTGVGSKITGSSLFPNVLKSDDRQRFEQAQRNFINAVLRRESGASIAPTEFESANMQYFPMPGDSQPVLLQKKRNRDMVTRSLLREANVDVNISNSVPDPLGIGSAAATTNTLKLKTTNTL